jgi:D-alanine-D-alanine ligase-like ATP-grasp enzyme
MDDPRIQRKLSRQGLDFQSVVQDGMLVTLLDNANLSSGGEAEDVTNMLHTDYKKMAIQLTHDMGLKFCGIDIMTPHPIHEKLQDYCILEINAAPGLDYYAEGGEVQKVIVKNLYRKILMYMLQT